MDIQRSEEKNQLVKLRLGAWSIWFEDVEKAIHENKVLAIISNENQIDYPWQDVMIVEIDKYAYRVPFKQKGDKIFLKTVYPSRKATKIYLSKKS